MIILKKYLALWLMLSSLLSFGLLSSTTLASDLEQVNQELRDDTVWIDVRSWLEHKVSNIEGDAHIPHSDIVSGVQQLGLAKTTQIALYCQSGGRSAKAVQSLQKAGYSNVVDAGGISEVKSMRFTEVKD